MNLMISFILRYGIIIIKDIVLDNHYSINQYTAEHDELKEYCETFVGGGLLVFFQLKTRIDYSLVFLDKMSHGYDLDALHSDC